MGGERQNGIGADPKENRQIAPEQAEKPGLPQLMAPQSQTDAASQNVWTRYARTQQAARTYGGGRKGRRFRAGRAGSLARVGEPQG